jgi:FSR family fosmidomycin resistance protein-like MFS transporter
MVLPGLLLSVVLYRAFDARGQAPGGAKRSLDIRISIGAGPVLALACMLVLRGATEMSIVAFLPLLIEQRGGALIAIGATIGLFQMSSAAGTLIAGFLSDRRGWKHVTILSLVAASALSWSFLRADGLLALILLALLGAALRVSFPYAFLMAQRLFPERASTASALVVSLSLLGGGLGALSSGFLADGLGVETALLVVGLSLPLGAAAATMGIRGLW